MPQRPEGVNPLSGCRGLNCSSFVRPTHCNAPPTEGTNTVGTRRLLRPVFEMPAAEQAWRFRFLLRMIADTLDYTRDGAGSGLSRIEAIKNYLRRR